jgi:hypothetical protein
MKNTVLLVVAVVLMSGCITETGMVVDRNVATEQTTSAVQGNQTTMNSTAEHIETNAGTEATSQQQNISAAVETPGAEEKTCPVCEDNNPCTVDVCGPETGYLCLNTEINGPASECSGNAGTCKTHACIDGSCVLATSTNCCGNQNCETNEDYNTCPSDCRHETTPTINEIMYAPNTEWGGQYNEWIEIYNPSQTPIDVTGWGLVDNEGGEQRKHNLPEGRIPPNSFIILAKNKTKFTSYYSVACEVFKVPFTLNNDNDALILYNPESKAIDTISYQNTAGGLKNNRTLERTVSGWVESAAKGGTPCQK